MNTARVCWLLVSLVVVQACGGEASAPTARAPLGGPCSRWADCIPTAELCLKDEGAAVGFCTSHCATDAECGPQAVCGTETITRSRGDSSRTGGERICVPRTP